MGSNQLRKFKQQFKNQRCGYETMACLFVEVDMSLKLHYYRYEYGMEKLLYSGKLHKKV